MRAAWVADVGATARDGVLEIRRLDLARSAANRRARSRSTAARERQLAPCGTTGRIGDRAAAPAPRCV
jgi:hypothetical protein